jgi:hypothetical protein
MKGSRVNKMLTRLYSVIACFLLIGVVMMCIVLLVGCDGHATDEVTIQPISATDEAAVRTTIESFFAKLNAGDWQDADMLLVGGEGFDYTDSDADLVAAYFVNGLTYSISAIEATGERSKNKLNDGNTITNNEAVATLRIARRDWETALSVVALNRIVGYLQELKLIQDSENLPGQNEIDETVRRIAIDSIHAEEPSVSRETTARLVKINDRWLIVDEQKFIDAIMPSGGRGMDIDYAGLLAHAVREAGFSK